jgi:hypothetical protein
VADASANGKRKINYTDFAREWNRTADGTDRYYVTADVLSAYAKSWDKTNNARASQELIAAKMDLVRQTGELFQEPSEFPASLEGIVSSAHPRQGVIELDNSDPRMPSSINVDLAISRPRITTDSANQQTQRAKGKRPENRAPSPPTSPEFAPSPSRTEDNSRPPVEIQSDSAAGQSRNLEIQPTGQNEVSV